MRVVLYPFYSQQDKTSGKFLFDSDSGYRLYSYMAKQMLEVGWQPLMVIPQSDQWAHKPELTCDAITAPFRIAPNNLDRRLQWEPSWLKSLAQYSKLILTQHEFLAYPLRCLAQQCKVVMECGIKPDTAWPQTAELFPMAWRSATAIHCNSEELASQCRPHCPNVFHWKFGYDDSMLDAAGSMRRDVDVIFPARASSTNYSNHAVFMQAMAPEWRVVMTDPTSYLRSQGLVSQWTGPEPYSRDGYIRILSRSKVVVGLTDNGYGGYAFQEAIAMGCVPVALRTPEYEALLGADWPYYCTLDDVRSIVALALERGWPAESKAGVATRIAQGSYSIAWSTAYSDLQRLLQ